MPRPYALYFILFVLLPQTAIAEADVCGGKTEAVRIEGAIDAASLKLADGRVIKLATVIAPLAIDGDTVAVIRAKRWLSEFANGKDATLYLASAAADRYGRLSAQAILVDGKRWLEAEMLAQGIARVFLVPDDKCAKALLRYEAKSRDTRAGLWSEPGFRIFDPEPVDRLLAAEGRFVVVEGIIRRVGEARGRVYLDFGRRFTEDFTIVVPDNIRKTLAAQGSDPKSWRGRRVRVRGILFSWGGPAIEVNLAQAIELLDLPKSE